MLMDFTIESLINSQCMNGNGLGDLIYVFSSCDLQLFVIFECYYEKWCKLQNFLAFVLNLYHYWYIVYNTLRKIF